MANVRTLNHGERDWVHIILIILLGRFIKFHNRNPRPPRLPRLSINPKISPINGIFRNLRCNRLTRINPLILEFHNDPTGHVINEIDGKGRRCGCHDGNDNEIRVEVFIEDGTVAEDTAYAGNLFRGSAR